MEGRLINNLGESDRPLVSHKVDCSQRRARLVRGRNAGNGQHTVALENEHLVEHADRSRFLRGQTLAPQLFPFYVVRLSDDWTIDGENFN